MNQAGKLQKVKLEELSTKAETAAAEVEQLTGENAALAEELRKLKILGAGGIQSNTIGQSSYFNSGVFQGNAAPLTRSTTTIKEHQPGNSFFSAAKSRPVKRQSLVKKTLPYESKRGQGLPKDMLDQIMNEDEDEPP